MPFLMNSLVLSWFKKKKNDGRVESPFLPSTSDPSVQIMFIFQFTEKKKERENISLKADSFNEL